MLEMQLRWYFKKDKDQISYFSLMSYTFEHTQIEFGDDEIGFLDK